ncbi:MAG: hemin uptake protein HemP [Methylophilaceae bacterium]|jgi:hemin uptake protein HemP|nr:hemin uptake protein HemP [Methylophilaceae bacterium]
MINSSDKPDTIAHAVQVGEGIAARKRINSRDLFGPLRELVIEHVGEEYRLRITNQGKLILTK